MAPTLSVLLTGFRGWAASFEDVVVVAQAAERLGVTTALLPDHVVMGSGQDPYPRAGGFPFGPDEPWLDPLVALSGIATATSNLRLGTGVLIAPLRPPVLLAKLAATLDHVSNGRAELGVGVGWQSDEYPPLGVPYAERWQRLDDALATCRACWGAQPVALSTPTISISDVWASPPPVQQRIPIWVGAGDSSATARRIAAHGDGWHAGINAGPEEIAAMTTRIRCALDDAGRGDAAVQVRAWLTASTDQAGTIDLDLVRTTATALHGAGATDLCIPVGLGAIGGSPTAIEEDLKTMLDGLQLSTRPRCVVRSGSVKDKRLVDSQEAAP